MDVLVQFDEPGCDLFRGADEGYWPGLRRALRPHGIIAVDNAVDNAVSHGQQLTGFRGLLEDDPSFAVSLQKTGDGVLTAVRTGTRGG